MFPRIWDQCNVVQDYLTVWDGPTRDSPVLVRLCGGDAVPDIVSRGPNMLLEFHTSPYDNPFHPVPLSYLPGFELEVQVRFSDSKYCTLMQILGCGSYILKIYWGFEIEIFDTKCSMFSRFDTKIYNGWLVSTQIKNLHWYNCYMQYMSLINRLDNFVIYSIKEVMQLINMGTKRNLFPVTCFVNRIPFSIKTCAVNIGRYLNQYKYFPYTWRWLYCILYKSKSWSDCIFWCRCCTWTKIHIHTCAPMAAVVSYYALRTKRAVYWGIRDILCPRILLVSTTSRFVDILFRCLNILDSCFLRRLKLFSCDWLSICFSLLFICAVEIYWIATICI